MGVRREQARRRVGVPGERVPDGWGLLVAEGGRVRSARQARRRNGVDAGLRAQGVRGLRGHRHRNVVWRE